MHKKIGFAAAALVAIATSAAAVQINEIRIDAPTASASAYVGDSEFIEIAGVPGTDLTGHSIVIIGDGAGASGTVEAVIALSGTIPVDGYLLVGGTDYTASFYGGAAADLSPGFGIENSDNLTFILVTGATSVAGDDLDATDDGTLDSTPWTTELDRIAVIEENNPPAATEFHYGPPTIGPDVTFVPGLVFRDGANAWQIGAFDHDAAPADDGVFDGADTPGKANAGQPTPFAGASVGDWMMY